VDRQKECDCIGWCGVSGCDSEPEDENFGLDEEAGGDDIDEDGTDEEIDDP
jgi:hypothetical protein